MTTPILHALFLVALPDLLVAAESGDTALPASQGLWGILFLIAGPIALGYIGFLLLKIRRMHASICRLTTALSEQTQTLTESDIAKETYKALYDLSMVGIFRTDLRGDKFIAINETCAEIFGYASPLEMMTSAVPRMVHTDAKTRDILIEELKVHGKIINITSSFVRKDGSIFYALFSACINQEAGYLEGTFLDVTQLKQTELQLAESRDYLQSVIDAIPIPISVKDREGKFTLTNEEMTSLIGITKDDFSGKLLRDFASQTRSQQHGELEQILLDAQGKASLRFENQGILHNISTTFLVYKETLLNTSGSVIGIVTALIDISRRKKMEEALRKAEEQYRNIYMNSLEGIFTSTCDGVFIDVNPAMAKLYGYDSPQAMLAEVRNVATEHWVEPELRLDMLAKLDEADFLSGYEVQIRRRDGQHIWVTFSIRAIKDAQGIMQALEGIAFDVTEKKQSVLELSLRASTDPLTGLANRTQLELSFEHMIAQAQRSGEKLGVLFIDLDGFKPINDNHGHEAGDALLREVSERIRKRVREADQVARMGGDEFVIILWDINDAEGLYRIGRTLLEELNSPYIWNSIHLRMGASIGGCIYPDHGDSAADLLRCADKAMYTIKQSGKNALRITHTPEKVCKTTR